MIVYVAPVGQVEAVVLAAVERSIGETLGFEMRRLRPLPEPAYAWDARRRQYLGSRVLRELDARRPTDAGRLLAVTELDLFIPMLTFIFGQAQLGGRLALVSLARLRQEFYGLPPDGELLRERALKESLHELGHTFGLLHCGEAACNMSLATGIRQLDAKGGGYCAGCAALLNEKIIRNGS